MFKPTEVKKHKETIIQKLKQNLSIMKICKEERKRTNNKFPSDKTVNEWLNKDPQFLEDYMRAKEEGFIFEGYKILDIADNAGLSKEEIQKASLQISTRQWFLGRLKPKRFGSNTNQTNIQVNVQPVTGMEIIDDVNIIDQEQESSD